MIQWAISFVSNHRGVRIFPVAGAEPSAAVLEPEPAAGEVSPVAASRSSDPVAGQPQA